MNGRRVAYGMTTPSFDLGQGQKMTVRPRRPISHESSGLTGSVGVKKHRSLLRGMIGGALLSPTVLLCLPSFQTRLCLPFLQCWKERCIRIHVESRASHAV